MACDILYGGADSGGFGSVVKAAKSQDSSYVSGLGERVLNEDIQYEEGAFQILPDDVVLHIFEYCDQFPNYASFARVCRRWSCLIKEPSLWRKVSFAGARRIRPEVVLSTLSRCTQMTSLSLAGCIGMGAGAIVRLFNDLSLVKDITYLDLSETEINNVSLKQVVAVSPKLSTLILRGCERIDDGCVELLTSGTLKSRLKHLYLDRCYRLTNGGCQAIFKNLEGLETLSLVGFDKMRDGTFTFLTRNEKARHSMRSIRLSGCHGLTDEGLVELSAFSNLRSIDLLGAREITDQCVRHIATGCKELRELNLSLCVKVTYVGIYALANNCTNLESLNLWALKEVKNDAIILLSSLPKLKHLNLLGCLGINYKGISALMAKPPQQSDGTYRFLLESLNLSGLSLSSDALVATSNACPDLQYLDVSTSSGVHDRGVGFVASKCHRLKDLNLLGCDTITANCISFMGRQCRHLRRLHMPRHISITDECISDLRDDLPNVEIIL